MTILEMNIGDLKSSVKKLRQEKFKGDLPSDLSCEQALIGGTFINNAVFDRVVDVIQYDHFYEPIHQQLWQMIGDFIKEGRRIDFRVAAGIVKDWEPLEDGTRIDAYLMGFGSQTIGSYGMPTMEAFYEYALRIKELCQRRAMFEIGVRMQHEAFVEWTGDETAQERYESYADAFLSAAEVGNSSNFYSIGDLSNDVFLRMQAPEKERGISTGFKTLDAAIGGLMPGNVKVLAGRPGMGKTAMGCDICMRAARNGTPVFFASMEMPAAQVVEREIMKLAGGRIDPGNEYRMSQVAKSVYAMSDVPFYIDETPALTAERFATSCRRAHRRHGIGLIMLDYLQLMVGRPGSRGNRNSELSHITSSIKSLAKELNVPIIVLSQLNRNVEGREIKRPYMSDLKDSGSIEQDADVVMLLHREAYYLAQDDTSDPAAYAKLSECENKAEIIIAKNRHGRPGSYNLIFEGDKISFRDPMPHELPAKEGYSDV